MTTRQITFLRGVNIGGRNRLSMREVKAALDEACAKIKAKGLLLGTYAENRFADWKRRGVDYMSVKNDTNAMLDGSSSAFAKLISTSSSHWYSPFFPVCRNR